MPPVPETFDEIVPEVPVTAGADFAPLPELGPTEHTDTMGFFVVVLANRLRR
jgi:hypothetical protein